MTEWAGTWAASLVSSNATLERELEQRLAEVAPLAFRVAYSVVRQRQDAEDVAQDALVRAHAQYGQLRDRECFRAWVVRIAWRLALDRRRSGKRRERREQAVVAVSESTSTPEDLAVARERQDRLWRAMDELPEKLRIVMVLAAIREHEMAEVALLLELPIGTVKSRLHEARKRLAERLR
jgi:RNA polymerase sigma-70 factor (ECF subfamily)